MGCTSETNVIYVNFNLKKLNKKKKVWFELKNKRRKRKKICPILIQIPDRFVCLLSYIQFISID